MNLALQFQPNLNIHEYFDRCINFRDEINNIFHFINLDKCIVEQETKQLLLSRLYFIHALDNIEVDVKKLNINATDDQLLPQEKAVIQYHHANTQLSDYLNEPLSISLYQKLYKLSFQSDNEENATQINHAALKELEILFDFINHDNEFHPLLQAWLLLLKALEYPVFPQAKFRMAVLLFNFWFSKNNLNTCNLINVEEELFLHKEQLMNLTNIYKNVPLNEKFEFGLNLYHNQLSKIKETLKKCFRKQMGFEKMTPREKNICNFIFEYGYQIKDKEYQTLNSRQKEILNIIKRKGFIGTKDLTSLFDCNRKTIQRDFGMLLQMGLVKVIGAGAGLKYCISMVQNKSNPFSNLQLNN